MFLDHAKIRCNPRQHRNVLHELCDIDSHNRPRASRSADGRLLFSLQLLGSGAWVRSFAQPLGAHP
eukprot:4424207-Alexandrium_andersonii.AAC.1